MSRFLRGTAVFAHDRLPCPLDYQVVCDEAWRTTSARVAGWVGDTTVDLTLSVDAGRRWRVNGAEIPEVTGCLDLDLSFSPSTNLLPIRRLELAIGQQAAVRAAWLNFPLLTLEPLEQIYRRVDVSTYEYESDGEFTARFRVNASGSVTEYPGRWVAEVGG